jgi:putative flippase GtrA
VPPVAEHSVALPMGCQALMIQPGALELLSHTANPLYTSFMKILRQLVSFGGVGAIATAIQYLILVVLTEGLDTDPVIASTIGYISSALLNYTLNYRFTFASDKPHVVALQVFALVAVVGSMLNAGIMYVLLHGLELNYLAAQVFATGVVFLWNFFAHRRFTFGNSYSPAVEQASRQPR